MATGAIANGLKSPVDLAKKLTGWYTAVAVLFILLGILAIAEPAVASLAVALLVGWLLLIGGVAHLVTAFGGGGVGKVVWQILVAIVYAIGGIYFLTHPGIAVGTLTLLLAGVILAEGVFEAIAYFKWRGQDGSGWMLWNAIITLLLGGLIWFHWPSSSVWAIGTLVGVNLLMTGFTRLMLGMAARKLVNRAA